MKTISAAELHKRILSGEQLLLIDVRQPEELRYGTLPQAKVLPMQEIVERINEVRELVSLTEEDVIIYCRSGGRSERVAKFLEQQGMREMYNLVGGVNAYSELDSEVKAY